MRNMVRIEDVYSEIEDVYSEKKILNEHLQNVSHALLFLFFAPKIALRRVSAMLGHLHLSWS